MRKVFLMLLILFSFHLLAQNSLKQKADTAINSDFISAYDSLNKIKEDSVFKETMEQNSRNLDDFLKYRKELEARQKRNALIRIGIGILFFIVLLVGLSRRRKKQQ